MGEYILKRDVNRFMLFLGIIFLLGGLNFIYLFTFSHSTTYLTVALINLVFGLICIILYRFPDLLNRYNISKKQSQEI